MNAESVTPPTAPHVDVADEGDVVDTDVSSSTDSDSLSLFEIVAQHFDAGGAWSRALAGRLRGLGYDRADVGAAARFHGVTKVGLVRSFLDTTDEEIGAACLGFELFDLVAMQASDVGVLPVFPKGRPRIYGAEADIRRTADEAWDAIGDANRPPQFFDLGGQAVWVKASRSAQAEVEEVTLPRMAFLLGEVADWFRVSRSEEFDMRPPKAVAQHLVATPHPRLPRMQRLVRCPVFDGDGRLVVRAGFHEDSGLFYAPRNLRVPPVLSRPTRREIGRAKSLLVDELLGEFPFVSDADRTNAVALVLLAFIRLLIDGPHAVACHRQADARHGRDAPRRSVVHSGARQRSPDVNLATPGT